MPMPTLTDSGQRLYDAVAPLMKNDAANGYAGAILCGALATIGLDDAAYFARDGIHTDTSGKALPSHAVLFDVDNVDAKWLPWLAQFVGDADAVSVADEATQRSLIKNPIHYLRGRPSSIEAAMQSVLTGTQEAIVSTSGNFALILITHTSENPLTHLILDSSFEAGTVGVAPTGAAELPGGTYTTFAVANTWANTGSNSLRTTWTNPGGSFSPGVQWSGPVVESQQYSYSTNYNILTSHTLKQLALWYDVAGNFITSTLLGTSPAGPHAGRLFGGFQSPRGASSVAVQVLVNSPSTTTSETIDFYLDDVSFDAVGIELRRLVSRQIPAWCTVAYSYN